MNGIAQYNTVKGWWPPSDAVGHDQEVAEASLAVRGEERNFDPGGYRRLGPQLPVGDGLRGQVGDVDGDQVVSSQRLEDSLRACTLQL